MALSRFSPILVTACAQLVTLWRRWAQSKHTTAAALAMLSDSTPPAIGMLTQRWSASSSDEDIPRAGSLLGNRAVDLLGGRWLIGQGHVARMAGSDTAIRRARMHRMADRLSALDASLLYAEEPTAGRDAVPDVDTLAVLIEELVPTVRGL